MLPNGVLVENYLPVAPSSAKGMHEQLNKSLLNAKTHTHSMVLKCIYGCDCKNYCCTSTRTVSNVVKCIGNAVVKIPAALAHIAM